MRFPPSHPVHNMPRYVCCDEKVRAAPIVGFSRPVEDRAGYVVAQVESSRYLISVPSDFWEAGDPSPDAQFVVDAGGGMGWMPRRAFKRLVAKGKAA